MHLFSPIRSVDAQRPGIYAQAAVCGILLCAYFALRLPHLRDQPVFCDEATYIRWAQLVHQDPWQNLLVSMQDAKLPLHYWLLALAWPLNADPLLRGRLLSVFLGALTIFPLLALCRELPVSNAAKQWLGPLATAFMIASPLVAISQRMVLAEPLLLLESVSLAWLSLRFARLIDQGAPSRSLVTHAIVLGLLWGATLLTKQNFSYLLWLLPPAALLCSLRRPTWKSQLRTFIPRYIVATLIGVACFVPALLTSSPYNLRVKLFYKPMFTVSSMNQTHWDFLTQNWRASLSPRSGSQMQWWPYDPTSPLDSGLLYLYLTPPILLLALGAIIWMLHRRMWRPLAFLGFWCAALLGSVLLGANVLYSRYLLLGAFPLILLTAWCVCQLLATLRPRLGSAWPAFASALLCMVLAWPLWATARGAADCRAPMLTRNDREAYLNGYATQQAIAWLSEQAVQHSITVITGTGLGIQNDFTWAMLSGRANVQLYADDSTPPLRLSPGRSDLFLAGTEQWIRQRIESVPLPAQRPIYILTQGGRDVKSGNIEFLPVNYLGAGSELVQTFINPPLIPGHPSQDAIAIYQLVRTSPIEASASPSPPHF